MKVSSALGEAGNQQGEIMRMLSSWVDRYKEKVRQRERKLTHVGSSYQQNSNSPKSNDNGPCCFLEHIMITPYREIVRFKLHILLSRKNSQPYIDFLFSLILLGFSENTTHLGGNEQ